MPNLAPTKIEDEDNEGAYSTEAPCQCHDKPFAAQCEGCRTTAEWEAGLIWLNNLIRKRSK
jgi:hypothetical protein